MKHRLLVIFVTLLFPIVSSADLYIAINDNYDLKFSIDGNPNDCKAVVKGVKDGKTLTRLSTIPQKMKFKHYVEQSLYLIGDNPYYLKDTIECSVIGIADEAFKGNTDLQTVNIPNHVKTLGKSVFANCTNLRSVEMSNRTDIPDNFFEGCVNLESFSRLALSNSFTSIGTRAFKNCNKLSTNIILSNDLEYVGKEAFYGCESVKTIEVSCSKDNVFIDEDAFWGCTGINKVNCTSLSVWLKITFSNPAANPLSYSHKLYVGNNLVSTLVIPDFATKIPAYAFYGCTSLSNVIMNHTNKHIEECGEKAFYGCENLNRVTIPKISFWCDITFADKYSNPLYYAHHMWEPPSATLANGREIDRLEIPNSVKRINAYAFYGANTLECIDIGGGVRRIGEEAFADCVPQEIHSYIIVPFTIPYNVFSPLAYANSELIVPNRTFSSGPSSLDRYKTTPSWCYFQNIRAIGEGIIHNISNTLTITAQGYGAVTYKNTEIVNETKSFPLFYDEYSGVDLKIAVKPDQGYEIGSFIVDGEMLPDSLYEDTITIVGAIGDINISVEFIKSEEPINSISYNSTINYQGLRYALSYESGIATVLGVSGSSGSIITIPAQLNFTEEEISGSTSSSTSGRIPSMSGTWGMFARSRVFKEVEMKTSDINSVTSVSQSNNRPLNFVVKVIGNDAFKNNTTITKVVIEGGVTTIWPNAFNGCKNLQQITLPNTLRFVDWQAFANCTKLESITIPKSVKTIRFSAFKNSGLKSVIFNADSINAGVFEACASLQNVIIGKSVRSICESAFEESAVTNVSIAHNGYLKSIDKRAFYKCVNLRSINLPAGLTSIGDMAFTRCDVLESISLPNSLTTLGQAAFSLCPGLERVSVGTCLKRIEQSTFNECTSLTEVTFSENSQLEYIGKWAFTDCTALTTFLMPVGVKELGETPFENCMNIETFRFSDGLTVIPERMFEDCTKLKSVTFGPNPKIKNILFNAFFNCKSLETFVMPNSVEYVDNQAFASSGLKNITFSTSLSKIGDSAFGWCDNLTEVTLPDNVKTLEGSTFYGCKNLKSFNMGNGLTEMYGGDLEGCTALESIQWSDCLKKIESRAFYNLGKLKTFIFGPNPKLEEIGDYAFAKTALTSFEMPSSVKMTGNHIFYCCTNLKFLKMGNRITEWDTSNLQGCNALESIQWSDGLKKIEDRAFYFFDNLKTFTFGPNPSLEVIGDRAFSYTGITSFEMPPTVKTLGEAAFNYCTSLENVTLSPLLTIIPSLAFNGTIIKEITIPAGVTYTGYSSLGSEGMTDVYILATTPPAELEDDWGKGHSPMHSSDAQKVMLHVPLGTKAAYAAATGWKRFKEIVEFGEGAIASGDLNGDGEINGTDLVKQTNLILTGGYNVAADLNNDNVVNGTDYVLLVNKILGVNAARLATSITLTQAPLSAKLLIEDFTIMAGETKEMLINLINPDTGVTLVQFDLCLPDGLSVVENNEELAIDIVGRTSWKRHSLNANATGNITRFLLASNTNALIEGCNGNIIRIKLTASDNFDGGNIMLKEMLLVTPTSDEMRPANYCYTLGGTTSMGVVEVGQSGEIYNLAGNKVRHDATNLNSLRKGLYLLNGKKVLIK